MKIQAIDAREVLDSRGNPTVEVEVIVLGKRFRAMVPSGASTGMHEAHELRDQGKRYGGKGVLKAVQNVKKIAKLLTGSPVTEQETIDQKMIELDGTEHKTKLGANAMLAVSMACMRAGAFVSKQPLFAYISQTSQTKPKLPIPMLNVLNGGRHAGLEHDIQEQMLIPAKGSSFQERLRMSVETYHTLGSLLKKKYGPQAILLGDEGGFVPRELKTVEARLDMLSKAVDEVGYTKEMKFAVDAAASEFYDKKKNMYQLGKKKYTAEQLVEYYEDLAKTYPLISLEDGMAEDDWSGWQELNQTLGRKLQLVGDDLLVTNTDRINRAIERSACNALLLKVNQIGTVTEALASAKLAMKHHWNVVVSHRSGETEDSFISDLVVGLGSGQCKFGAPARSERNAKYNQLLRIEEQLRP